MTIASGNKKNDDSPEKMQNQKVPVQHEDLEIQNDEYDEVDFPLETLNRLDEMINKPRWIVPVLPDGELEKLLNAAIKLCKEGKKNISWFLS